MNNRIKGELSTRPFIELIFEDNQFSPFPCFSFVPKTGMGLPKTTGGSLYCELAGDCFFPI